MVLEMLLLGTGAVGVFCLVFQLLFKAYYTVTSYF